MLEPNELLDALDAVTWYNGLAVKILEWKKPGVVDYNPHDGMHYFGDKLTAWFGQLAPEDRHQVHLFWMIGVYLFGAYGTSPRYGWIERWEDFCQFIDLVTVTYREDMQTVNNRRAAWVNRCALMAARAGLIDEEVLEE